MSCESFEHESEFDNSFQKWQSFKEKNSNLYRYISTGSSWGAGITWETEIVVESGEIVGRNFRYVNFENIVRPVTGWDQASANQVLEKLPHLNEYLKEKNLDILSYLE